MPKTNKQLEMVQKIAKENKIAVKLEKNQWHKGKHLPTDSFYQFAGVWETNELTAETLRTQAWQRSTKE
jgi:hypothetical protein